MPGALGAALFMLAIPASAAAHSPGAPGVGGEPLAALFDTWLFQPSKPDAPTARAASLAKAADAPARLRSWRKISATNDVHAH
ncbi:hypothetical protein FM21_16770 [Streptomyces mutabilis]|uniref:Uncharacterized protein n=1 Tax=Streptomyces mutabilis TaxID=67332 RepID=A0A086MUJ1_9ACTN|nr:hypothetical protein FM21_16770 [Streptomyces mutabilis]